MDFAPSSSLTKEQVGKTGFRLSKKPAILFPVFSKCHAALTKALSCFRYDFHLSSERGCTGTTWWEAPHRRTSESRSIQPRRKINFSPISHLWSYQLKRVPIGPDGAWGSRAEPLGSERKSIFLSRCWHLKAIITLYTVVSELPLFDHWGVSEWIIYHVMPQSQVNKRVESCYFTCHLIEQRPQEGEGGGEGEHW